MTRLRCPVCSKENGAKLGPRHKASFKCDGCGTEVLVERHATEDAHHRHPKKEQYRLHPKRA